MKNGVIQAVAAAAMVTGAASAQVDAVQWRVEDGGNGHWYALTTETLAWLPLQIACEQRGGHLVTLTSMEEWSWVKTTFPVPFQGGGGFVGAFQDVSAPTYSEPNGGWTWVTNEPFALEIDYMYFDDCPGGVIGSCGCGPQGAQDVLFITGCCNNSLDDIGDGLVQNCDSFARRGYIEWSADCNFDGIVDFGQIRAGELEDANANNIPDCCEQGTPCACPGDLNGDGVVNGADIGAILAFWGPNPVFTAADITRDGQVNGADIGALLSTWGPCGQ